MARAQPRTERLYSGWLKPHRSSVVPNDRASVIWVKYTEPKGYWKMTPCHPSHCLFTLLPSRQRYRSIHSHTTRPRSSYFPEDYKIRLFYFYHECSRIRFKPCFWNPRVVKNYYFKSYLVWHNKILQPGLIILSYQTMSTLDLLDLLTW